MMAKVVGRSVGEGLFVVLLVFEHIVPRLADSLPEILEHDAPRATRGHHEFVWRLVRMHTWDNDGYTAHGVSELVFRTWQRQW